MAAAEYLVVATSLRPGSLSRIMAATLVREYETLRAAATLLDLCDHPLPVCDGDQAYSHPSVAVLSEQVAAARVIVLASPVYNFDLNAAAKNLIELTGSSWEDKIVGFLCAAGGDASYMSAMSLANSLMLDFRCVILPRFVYAKSSDFADGVITNPKIQQRLQQFAESSTKLRQS